MNLNHTIEAARNVLRFRHMALKTEKSYTHWIRRFAYWCKDHPVGNHADKVRGFLTYLAREKDVSASTQNQGQLQQVQRQAPRCGRPQSSH